RGHSLGRSMYGFNYTGTTFQPGGNNIPFRGTGRLHSRYEQTSDPPALRGADDYTLVNYTFFPSFGDQFLRDPERYGLRTGSTPQAILAAAPGRYAGGFNAPYTYPDLNSFFLAAVKADGTVLARSFHRDWLFNPGRPFHDPGNPNWTNAVGKYLTPRPRPQEHLGFPPPEDAGRDVKNLAGRPGGNDSIWIDLGAPVMTAPDGRKFKMLAAPLIMDLDGLVNVNVAGNVGGAGGAHRSHQGWGPWEINLGQVLTADDREW